MQNLFSGIWAKYACTHFLLFSDRLEFPDTDLGKYRIILCL